MNGALAPEVRFSLSFSSAAKNLTMPTTPQIDQQHMHRALTLAREAAAEASPNPTVGCVLVKDEKVVGEGAHHYSQKDHAEVVALKIAGANAENATAYVTLEPCSHHGRTGPCADALIAAKIKRVVIATNDPNPKVSGQGIQKLRNAGIEVTLGLCEKEARTLNDAFAKFIQTHTPFITLKAALSVDGKLAPPPHTRAAKQPHWLTGPAARAEVQRLRHTSDAILTGIGTILADDPALTDRTGLARRSPLLRVVLDTALATPLDSQLIHTLRNDVLLICAGTAEQERVQLLEARGAQIEFVPANATGTLDLAAVLAILAKREILSVLVEAGPRINGALLRANLVDKAVLFYAPTELGTGALPFADGIASPYLFEQNLKQTTRTTFGRSDGEDACITGYLHDPWQMS
jgi:diaminohydroxyphosphoribosylaminopyrimidine deaminase / 5-amino-6-(5-phosphoribosylamino)uracil reductase